MQKKERESGSMEEKGVSQFGLIKWARRKILRVWMGDFCRDCVFGGLCASGNPLGKNKAWKISDAAVIPLITFQQIPPESNLVARFDVASVAQKEREQHKVTAKLQNFGKIKKTNGEEGRTNDGATMPGTVERGWKMWNQQKGAAWVPELSQLTGELQKFSRYGTKQ